VHSDSVLTNFGYIFIFLSDFAFCSWEFQDVFCETMSELLWTASVLVDSSLGKDAISSNLFDIKGQIETISLDIASIACRMLSALERKAVQNETVVQCFSTCVLLLSSFMERCQSDARDCNATFTSQLCEVFQQQYTIDALLRQAQIYQNDVILYEPVSLVLDLLTKMASFGDAAMLTLLLGSAGTIFKPLCPLPISQRDERHPIWLSQLNLIGSCVRSATSNIDRIEASAERCRKFAESFLAENQSPLLGCLQFCGAVEFGPNPSRDNKFSRALLREAKFIVAIVSRLYSRDAMNDGRFENSALYQAYTRQSISLTVSLSTFLGASAMARDLFNALNDDEVTDMMLIDQGADPMRHGPLYRVLSNGLQNAKHEAIRFASHFVLNCVQPVSSEDKMARQIFTSPGEYTKNETVTDIATESSSISELEHECRSGITNLFAYQTELEAAECLTHVMKILYSTHPASSSFLRVTADQPRRAVWTMVVPGTVIRYYDQDSAAAGPCLKLAKVLRCDSVNQRWFVQPITDGGRGTDSNIQREGIVAAAQLVELEDPSRRVPILSFLGAPETSSDLEKISQGPAPSIGHLILILRWCCQFEKETLSSADILASHDDCRFTSIYVRLAEIVALVLGLDLSIQRETGRLPLLRLAEDPSAAGSSPTPSTGTPVDGTNTMIIADQILDLFGEPSDFAAMAFSSPRGHPRQGRLHGMLGTESWHQARTQLHSYVHCATVPPSPRAPSPHRTDPRGAGSRGGVGPMMIARGSNWGR
jgi:hypothetical protein